MKARDPDLRIARQLWVPKPFGRRIRGSDPGSGFPHMEADALIAKFIGGFHLKISLKGDPNKRRPDLERLKNHNEVWALCFRQPNDRQWRMFGRFYAKNIFVCMSMHDRNDLDPPIEYDKKACEAIVKWESFGSDLKYVKSNKRDSFLSRPVTDVDESIF